MDKEELYELGLKYHEGDGVPQDMRKEKAAIRGVK